MHSCKPRIFLLLKSSVVMMMMTVVMMVVVMVVVMPVARSAPGAPLLPAITNASTAIIIMSTKRVLGKDHNNNKQTNKNNLKGKSIMLGTLFHGLIYSPVTSL